MCEKLFLLPVALSHAVWMGVVTWNISWNRDVKGSLPDGRGSDFGLFHTPAKPF